MKKQTLVAFFLVLAAILLAGILPAGSVWAAPVRQAAEVEIPFPNAAEAAEKAANWLVENHQNEDGGYSSFSAGANLADSDIGGTVDALLALAATGVDLDETLEYLEDHADEMAAYAELDGAKAGKTIQALVVAGADSEKFGGQDFVDILKSQLAPEGAYQVITAFDQSMAILGLSAAGEPVPDEAVTWLLALQANDDPIAGSWDDGFGTAGNSDATAMAIMALKASGAATANDSIDAAVSFLVGAQLNTGGWEYGAGFGENANSTALVLGALDAIGQDCSSAESPWRQDGVGPQEALLAWQSETGAFQADFGEGRADNFFSTVQAVPSLFSDEATETASTVAGGDSILPYLIIGAVVILVGGLIIWLRRSGQV